MELKYMVQETPNPNAKKFVFNKDMKAMGKASFLREEDKQGIVLVEKLFANQFVKQLHFFDNIITITKEDGVSWEPLQDELIEVVKKNIDQHDIFFKKIEQKKQGPVLSPKLQEIDDIISETIRPSLQRDGGDLFIYEYLESQNLLVVEYEGACVSCPSSTVGTLMAIRNVLMERWNSEIKVITKEQFEEAIKEN